MVSARLRPRNSGLTHASHQLNAAYDDSCTRISSLQHDESGYVLEKKIGTSIMLED